MASTYKTPGVYREDVFLKPEVKLPTGVPGFVGFADVMGKGETSPNVPVSLHRKEEFATKFIGRPDSYLADAVAGFFDNGGVRCYVVRGNSDPGKSREEALLDAVEALAPLNDLDLVAIPDAMTLRMANNEPDTPAITNLQNQVLAHCARHGNRLAILDGLPGSIPEKVLSQRIDMTVGQTGPVNGALYYPWLKMVNGRFVPPCGHIAGIFSRTDAKVGVFKAPANEEVLGVLDLEINVDNQIQDLLNPEGINCLRAFSGRGIRVWGARTLSRDPNWRYINVRRIFLTLQRWIDMNMGWAAFEPNAPLLWVRIGRELTTYLGGLWQAGALKGQTAEEAFYVKCDTETNPPETREVGGVITEIGLAPNSPAEFVVVRILHRVEN
ncbi:MAG: phage tail sheath subtilisin-like domain-containing protein [Methanoregulaceae archaeon]|nr:phage tail sheath subtilisin-like domain-containing protein [Methanoregulaceae archaeon]